MPALYAVARGIASNKKQQWLAAAGEGNPGSAKTAAGSSQPADLFLGHHALDILGLALDAVARAAVRLDRQAADDGIDAALLDDGAALRALQLVVNIVIDRVVVRHRPVSPWKNRLLVRIAQKGNISLAGGGGF